MVLEATLKSAKVRAATLDDAEGIAELGDRLSDEAEYLLVSGIDPVTGSELIKASLERQADSPKSAVFVADVGDSLVGIALCREHHHPAHRGIVQFDVGIVESHRRRGIGKKLIRSAIEWAILSRAHRIQLAVMKDNFPAVRLYEQSGFQREGTLRRGARIKGEFVDVYVMAKLLPEP